MNNQEIILKLARQIAIKRGYTNLVNGLQPKEILLQKFKYELLEELAEVAGSGQQLEVYHELADCYYYAICLDAQDPEASLALQDEELISVKFAYFSGRNFGNLHRAFVTNYIFSNKLGNPPVAMKAALAKYEWRSAYPEDHDREIELIAQVLSQKN